MQNLNLRRSSQQWRNICFGLDFVLKAKGIIDQFQIIYEEQIKYKEESFRDKYEPIIGKTTSRIHKLIEQQIELDGVAEQTEGNSYNFRLVQRSMLKKTQLLYLYLEDYNSEVGDQQDLIFDFDNSEQFYYYQSYYQYIITIELRLNENGEPTLEGTYDYRPTPEEMKVNIRQVVFELIQDFEKLPQEIQEEYQNLGQDQQNIEEEESMLEYTVGEDVESEENYMSEQITYVQTSIIESVHDYIYSEVIENSFDSLLPNYQF